MYILDHNVDKELHISGIGYFLQDNGTLDPNFDALIVPKVNFLPGSNNSSLTSLKIGTLEISNTSDIVVESCMIRHIQMFGVQNSTIRKSWIENLVDNVDLIFTQNCQGLTINNNFMSNDPDANADVNLWLEQNCENTRLINNILFSGQVHALTSIFENNIFADALIVDLEFSSFQNNLFALTEPVSNFNAEGNTNNVSALNLFPNLTGQDLTTIFSNLSAGNEEGYSIVTGSTADVFATDGGEVGMFGGTTPYILGGGSKIYPVIQDLVYTDCLQGEIIMPLTFTAFSPLGNDITQIEYYIDVDMGPGMGIPIQFTNSFTTFVFEGVELGFYGLGVHIIGIRITDATGISSPIFEFPFKIEEEADAAAFVGFEAFIDDDPGLGLATTVPDLDPAEVLGAFNGAALTEGVTAGIRTFGIRGVDENGNFSTTHFSTVLVIEDQEPIPIVDQVEFFFDDDAGFGNGVFQTSLNENEAIVQVPLDNVNQGVHDFFVRVKDSNGEWSTTLIKPILILAEEVDRPNLTSYEYYFDQEPGIGNGTLVDVTPGQDFDGTLNIPLNDLMQGQHQLYVRFIDENGDVGTTYYQFFEVLPDASGCADFNDDGTVNGSDLLAFLSFYDTENALCETGDFNGDGMVSGVDLLIFLSFFN